MRLIGCVFVALIWVMMGARCGEAVGKPVLYIIGDSTVNAGKKGPAKGWGDAIGRFFDKNAIEIKNNALSGRSSRTFQTEGHWEKVLQNMKAGDFVLMQFGHNDAGPLDDTARARGTIRGIGDESKEIDNPIMKKKEVVYTYGWYMRKYISDTRAKGATPIVCSPIPRVPKEKVAPDAVDSNSYIGYARDVAKAQDCAFIDLNHNILKRFAGMTPEEIQAKYYVDADHTHTNPAGADLNAQAVVEGIRGLKESALVKFLLEKPEEPAAAPKGN